MSQTKRMSLFEQFCNVGSGFVLSLLIWVLVVKPVWDIDVSYSDNLAITVIFTFASIARGYVWRRLFNRVKSGGSHD